MLLFYILLLHVHLSSLEHDTPQHPWAAQPSRAPHQLASTPRHRGLGHEDAARDNFLCTEWFLCLTHACKHHTTNHRHRARALIGPSALSTQPVSQRPLHSFIQARWLTARAWSCFLLSFLPSFLRLAGCDRLNAVVYCFCFHI